MNTDVEILRKISAYQIQHYCKNYASLMEFISGIQDS